MSPLQVGQVTKVVISGSSSRSACLLLSLLPPLPLRAPRPLCNFLAQHDTRSGRESRSERESGLASMLLFLGAVCREL